MGVPGFFKWICEKYKAKNIIFDNIDKRISRLYLDANCLFHPQCFKTVAENENWKSLDDLERKMIKKILLYIQFLIEYAEPTDCVFISVDGVAPLAKMNQQRKRRFKSAHDEPIINEIKIRHNKPIDRWSNMCITPGTEFMEKLNNSLLKFIKNRKDGLKYVLSGYHVRGEGEHKILEDIRKQKLIESEKDKAYCVYGLDADLIFLSLASQKNNLFLLRETIEFKNLKPKDQFTLGGEYTTKEVAEVAQEVSFVNIDILKDMFTDYFTDLIHTKLSTSHFGFDEPKINKINLINDFIFICYFLGNDFLPHFPSINIKQDGLDIIVNAYINVFIFTKYQNIMQFNETENKININPLFLKFLLKELNDIEDSFLVNQLPKYKMRLLKKRCPEVDPFKKELWELNNLKDFDHDSDPVRLSNKGSEERKHRYYEYYFHCSEKKQETIHKVVQNYFDGLLWVANYYFTGCPSYCWQYPFNHAPFISDLYEYIEMHNNPFDMTYFDKSPSLTPFQQLLAVLPPKGSSLLPHSYKKLVTDDDSPIIDYYPIDFEVDLYNKTMFWEGIPDIPSIESNRIKLATEKLYLSDEDKKRNTFEDNIVV